MARNRHSLSYQAKQILDSKLRIGESKHRLKREGEDITQWIFSFSTYTSYLKHINYFINYARQEYATEFGRQPRKLEDCRKYVEPFMRESISKHSPWTCQLQVCALAKLYNCCTTNFGIDLPKRKRSKIKRSRHLNQMDRHFSEKNNADLVSFCKCTGLRRRELAAIKGSDLYIDENGIYKLNVTKGTKGGRPRQVCICYETQEELDTVIRLCKEAGNSNVFKKISSAADVHFYRHIFCLRTYEKHARPFKEYKTERLVIFRNRVIGSYKTVSGKKDFLTFESVCKANKIPLNAKGLRDVSSAYYCRDDLKGKVLDRKAMLICSQALGHNRETVLQNYIY